MDPVLRETLEGSGCQVVEKLLPRIVLVPDDEKAIARLTEVAVKERLRICVIGKGTSFPANYEPLEDLIFLMSTQMNQLLDLRPLDAHVVVEVGMLASDLARHLEGTDLDFPVSLAEYPGTLGGAVLGPDRSGLRHAEIRRRLLGLELVDPRGRLLRFGSPAIKNVAGYNYWTYLVGTNGRFGVLTRLILNLEKMPALDQISHLEPLCNSDVNPACWIFANLCKGLDPNGIFVR